MDTVNFGLGILLTNNCSSVGRAKGPAGKIFLE